VKNECQIRDDFNQDKLNSYHAGYFYYRQSAERHDGIVTIRAKEILLLCTFRTTHPPFQASSAREGISYKAAV